MEHPRVFVSYSHDNEHHKTLVREFAKFLCAMGMKVELDQWADTKRINWSTWAEQGIANADYVLAIASPDFKRRADGHGVADDDGRGAQSEAETMRELLTARRSLWFSRMLPVVLPGRSPDEIPLFLRPHSATHYVVGEFTRTGAAELLAVLNRTPPHRRPEIAPFTPDLDGTSGVDWGDPDVRDDPLVDALAFDLKQLWIGEERRYSIWNPRPMDLRWSATDRAEKALGGKTWESVGIDPADTLAGNLAQAGELVRRSPHKRLVILGDAGAGKSVLLIRLMRDVLTARRPGYPIPVLLPLGAWDPAATPLDGWIIARLRQDYSGLAEQVTSMTGTTRSRAELLFLTGRIVPVLDGFDEIAPELRGTAIESINRLGSGLPLVVTSRADEYIAGIHAAHEAINRAVPVELHGLEVAEVSEYLDELNGPVRRWQPVIDRLAAAPDGPLSRTLRTPLMLWLARTVHAGGSVAELCELNEPEDLENHLLDELVPALYLEHPPPAADRSAFRDCRAEDVGPWLTFLARHVRDTGTTDLAWWRLQKAVPAVVVGTRFLTGAVLGYGLGHLVGPITGLVLALLLGVVTASEKLLELAGVRGDLEVPHTFRTRPRFVRNDILTALTIPFTRGLGLLVMGIAAAVAVNVPPSGWPAAAALAVVFLLGLAHTVWVEFIRPRPVKPGTVAQSDVQRVAKPEDSLRGDRKQVLVVSLPAVGAAALFVALGWNAGAVLAAAAGAAWFLSSAYGRFVITRFVLAMGDRLPWRPMAFFADAHHRGVLRQVGAVYQFRHARLCDRLVDAPKKS